MIFLLLIWTWKREKGNLLASIDLNQKDEVGELADALKLMATQLKKIVYEVKSVSDSVSSGSLEISKSSQVLSEGASEQAASTEEVSASMEQMISNIEQNTEHSGDLLQKIVPDIQKTSELIQGIFAASSEQSSGAQQ
ncbi:MAG: hypothetical protein B6241_07960, partial [Spirochaetaceae bacterium 4572_59]